MKMAVNECYELRRMMTEQSLRNISITFLLCQCWEEKKNRINITADYAIKKSCEILLSLIKKSEITFSSFVCSVSKECGFVKKTFAPSTRAFCTSVFAFEV